MARASACTLASRSRNDTSRIRIAGSPGIGRFIDRVKLLKKLQHERGLSYLLITHDVDVIKAMAHQVIVMKDGQVVEAGSLAQIVDAPRHPYTQMLVAAQS